MTLKRLFQTIGLCLTPGSGFGRAKYLKKHDILGGIGDNCSVMSRVIPLYPKLIKLGDNVHIASNVSFVTHDIIYHMINRSPFVESHLDGKPLNETVGCIEIGDNVFIGANTTILSNTKIGNNVIIGACSLVNKDIPDNCVYAGVPAKFICSIDDYLIRVKEKSNYPINLRPAKQEASDELIKWAWDEFYSNRNT